MVVTISLVTMPLTETPAKTSAPSMASARVRASVSTAKRSLYGFMPCGAALVDDALGVDHEEVLGFDAEGDVEVGAGDARPRRRRRRRP